MMSVITPGLGLLLHELIAFKITKW